MINSFWGRRWDWGTLDREFNNSIRVRIDPNRKVRETSPGGKKARANKEACGE